LDCTFGLGGHSTSILRNSNSHLTAIDCDPSTIYWAQEVQEEFGDRFQFINKKFTAAVDYLIPNCEKEKFDFVLCDFGLSSLQIDNKDRGFSYSQEAPLSMSMCGNTMDRCQYIINKSDINELANIIRKYGEENAYYKIAKEIIANRPIHSTGELRRIIERASYGPEYLKIKTVARVFQAIRIYTNQELQEIETLLNNMDKICHKNTLFILIYFHSLEGKEVFNFLRKWKKTHQVESIFLTASSSEVMRNNRARSARMLVIKPTETKQTPQIV
jgi:16S rRNA (cytosine1402-N4)-methyltransferase